MYELETMLKAWDEAMWEYSLALEELPDEDLWRRPHPRLLSIGEITGHMAYWEAQVVRDAGQGEPPASPLLHEGFRYYTTNVESPVSLPLTVLQVGDELKNLHAAARAAVLDKDMSAPVPGREGFTWGPYLMYRAFHNAYHTGQAYSVRHFFGQDTTDN